MKKLHFLIFLFFYTGLIILPDQALGRAVSCNLVFTHPSDLSLGQKIKAASPKATRDSDHSQQFFYRETLNKFIGYLKLAYVSEYRKNESKTSYITPKHPLTKSVVLENLLPKTIYWGDGNHSGRLDLGLINTVFGLGQRTFSWILEGDNAHGGLDSNVKYKSDNRNDGFTLATSEAKVHAFESVFGDIDRVRRNGNAHHLALFGAPKEYTNKDLSFLPEEYTVQIPPSSYVGEQMLAFARIEQRINSEKNLTFERDLGVNFFDDPEIQKKFADCTVFEISRLDVLNNSPITSYQIIYDLIRFMFLEHSNLDPDKIILVATAYDEDHVKLWGRWGLKPVSGVDQFTLKSGGKAKLLWARGGPLLVRLKNRGMEIFESQRESNLALIQKSIQTANENLSDYLNGRTLYSDIEKVNETAYFISAKILRDRDGKLQIVPRVDSKSESYTGKAIEVAAQLDPENPDQPGIQRLMIKWLFEFPVECPIRTYHARSYESIFNGTIEITKRTINEPDTQNAFQFIHWNGRLKDLRTIEFHSNVNGDYWAGLNSVKSQKESSFYVKSSKTLIPIKDQFLPENIQNKISETKPKERLIPKYVIINGLSPVKVNERVNESAEVKNYIKANMIRKKNIYTGPSFSGLLKDIFYPSQIPAFDPRNRLETTNKIENISNTPADNPNEMIPLWSSFATHVDWRSVFKELKIKLIEP